MKVVASERGRPGMLGVKKDGGKCVMKSTSIEFRGETFNLSEEMKECFLKLSKMVPDVPRNESGNIDGTELMQYVIDYIQDLELQLDGQVSLSSLSSSLQSKLSGAASVRDCREPLSEKPLDNIRCSSQVLSSPSHADVLVSRTSECEIRPPSK